MVLSVELTKLESPMPELEMLAFPMNMETGGASGALVKMEGCPSGGLGTLVYFSCEDCGFEASRVDSAGGKVSCYGPTSWLMVAPNSHAVG